MYTIVYTICSYCWMLLCDAMNLSRQQIACTDEQGHDSDDQTTYLCTRGSSCRKSMGSCVSIFSVVDEEPTAGATSSGTDWKGPELLCPNSLILLAAACNFCSLSFRIDRRWLVSSSSLSWKPAGSSSDCVSTCWTTHLLMQPDMADSSSVRTASV